jgi:hypothetical protein
MLASQIVLPDVAESDVLMALLLTQSGAALALQLLGIGSAYFLFVEAIPLFVTLSLDALLNPSAVVSLWVYALGLIMPLLAGTKLACIILDVFVPLVCPRLGARILFHLNLFSRPDAPAQMRPRNISLHPSLRSYYHSLHRSLPHSRTAFRELYG